MKVSSTCFAPKSWTRFLLTWPRRSRGIKVPKRVHVGFDPNGLLIPTAQLLPSRQAKTSLKASSKYQSILASFREVGIIEPLVVFSQGTKNPTYLVLDGHLRLEALKELGQSHARCLLALDDEAYTYNKRINRVQPIQEHRMIANAIRSGVSEERIGKVLNLDVAAIRQKRDLLDGICKEAAEILKNQRVASGVFAVLKKAKSLRQIEIAELLFAASNCSVPYTKALLAATPPEMLVDPDRHKVSEGLTPEQMARMEKEMDIVQRTIKQIEETHGSSVLNLVLARGYLTKLFGNARVTKYLTQHYADIFRELQTVVDGASLEH